MRRRIQGKGARVLLCLGAATFVAGAPAPAFARSAPAHKTARVSLAQRAKRALTRGGYTRVNLTCSTNRRCRWTAQLRRQLCSGSIVPGRGVSVRITGRRCLTARKSTPARRRAPSPHALASGGGPTASGNPSTPSHPFQFGFNTYITPHTISEEQQLGATVTRMIIAWSTVEASPGQWDWQQSDQEYSELLTAGMRPEIVVFAAPCWARPSMACNDGQYTGPPDPAYDQSWSRFVAQVAARYPRAIGIEVWNEPNLSMFFWPQPDPARFTQLLREAYVAVKSVDPAMPVVSGGIAGSPASGMVPLGEGDRPFLAAMYEAGAAGYMDAVAAHPYPISFKADGSQTWNPAAMEQSLDRLRSARDAAGDSKRPIWITEVGESTSTQPGFPPAVSAAAQAADETAMILSVRADADVPVMLLMSLEDQSAGTADTLNGVNSGFGVLDSTGAPKPAGCAISALLHGSLSC